MSSIIGNHTEYENKIKSLILNFSLALNKR